MRKFVECLVVGFLTMVAAIAFVNIAVALSDWNGALLAACVIFLIVEIAVCTYILLDAIKNKKDE